MEVPSTWDGLVLLASLGSLVLVTIALLWLRP